MKKETDNKILLWIANFLISLKVHRRKR